jgi:hypothetical protein
MRLREVGARRPGVPGGRLHRRVAAAAVVAAAAAGASAQSITPAQGLSFGAFVAGSGGAVVVGVTGARSRTGGITLVGQGAAASAAQFTVTGSPDAYYTIALPDAGTIVELVGPGSAMRVSGFVSSPSGRGQLLGGTQTLAVGATLTVGSNQTAGAYTGAFSVTVTYE